MHQWLNLYLQNNHLIDELGIKNNALMLIIHTMPVSYKLYKI